MEPTVARVFLLDVPTQADKPYDYHIPPELRDCVEAGSFVLVPFGGGNRKQLALISELACVTEVETLKPLLSLACPGITLSKEQLGLVSYMRSQTFCTTGDAVSAILPPSALTHLRDIYRPASPMPEPMPPLTSRQDTLLRFLSAFGRVTVTRVLRDLGEGMPELLPSLCRLGVVKRETEFYETQGEKTVETVSLSVSNEEALSLADTLRAPKQAQLLRVLAEKGPQTLPSLREEYGITSAQVQPLVKRCVVKSETESVFRDPYENMPASDQPLPPLSDAQNRAKEEITSLLHEDGAHAALLRGVTGSGKTRVIQAVMDEVIASGKGVILLVPEIALTPQAIAVFRSYYGSRAVVVHSRLSAGERYDAWRKVRDGLADVCIGTRSAVFAPFERLGLIVIDEEQEQPYKSDMNPKYHARDIARFRCAHHGALMLLASATPSIESQYRASEGRYKEVVLSERFGGAVLPTCVFADLRQDSPTGQIAAIGSMLRDELQATLDRKEQAILLVNRRGYHHFLTCPQCGTVLTCPHCSVSFTYHAAQRNRGAAPDGDKEGYLLCHYCGTREPVPSECPTCGGSKMRRVGYGTQKAEEELRLLFPTARVLRLDADTTASKFACDEILSSFRNGEADFLIGTQMVAKGHDFPNVTLVGVLNADSALYVDDYRAFERTFNLITQVVGRAGCADKPGRALIQTFNPDHPVLRLAASQDYAAFYRSEIALRRSLVFPPCCDIVLLSLTSEDENELNAAAEKLSQLLDERQSGDFSDVSTVNFGPIEAPLYKINETYRKNFLIKCRFNARTREMIRDLICAFDRKAGKRVTLSADVNPSSI